MVKKGNLKNALARLDEALAMAESEFVRDATIQRFEFTFELALKSLRDFIKQVHGIICISPKQCFREGFSLELYGQEETESLLRMVDDRNETTHTYDENRIAAIYQQIKNSYQDLLHLIYRITEH